MQKAADERPSVYTRGVIGAGDGNRTYVSSLGSYSSTIELRPQCAVKVYAVGPVLRNGSVPQWGQSRFLAETDPTPGATGQSPFLAERDPTPAGAA